LSCNFSWATTRSIVAETPRVVHKSSYCVFDLETSLCSEPAVLLSWFEQNLSTKLVISDGKSLFTGSNHLSRIVKL
jgi:hypothetical protein